MIAPMMSLLSGRGLGLCRLAADFVKEVKHYYPSESPSSLRDRLSDIFDELNISEAVVRSAFDVVDIFESYEGFLNEHGLIDEVDIVKGFGEYSAQWVAVNGKLKFLIIDGFSMPSPAETNALVCLVESAEDTAVIIPYEDGFRGITEGFINVLKTSFNCEDIFINANAVKSFNYHSYPGVEEEIEGIARSIKSLYLSGKLAELRDVAVAFPDMLKRSVMIKRVFAGYGIPCENDLGEPLMSSPRMLDLFCLLESVAEGYPRLKFSQFLSSKYFSAIPNIMQTFIPSLSLQSGIVAGRDSWLRFFSGGSENISLEDIKSISGGFDIKAELNKIFITLKPLDEIKDKAGLALYAKVLKDTLSELGFNTFHDAEGRTIKEVVDEAIDRLIYLGEVSGCQVSFEEFNSIFRHLINNASKESEGKGVRITDIDTLCETSAPYVYLGGLTDGAMPRRLDVDYILPDSVKKKMGMLHMDTYLELERFKFYRLAGSSKEIHLSYPLMDGDNVFLPSSFLFSGEEVRESITGIFSKEEFFIANGGVSLLNYIGEVGLYFNKDERHKKFQVIRVTDIDAYRVCPRKFFVEKALGLEPLKVKEYEVEAATTGTIVHAVMERIIREPFADFDTLKERALRAVEDVMKDRRIDEYWKDIIADSFMELLPDIYDNEMILRGDGYIRSETEKPMFGEPLPGIKLRGKIDRIDYFNDSVRIIDYKTATADLNCSQVHNGRVNLQLFLYAAMLKHQKYRVDRAGIYSLKEMKVKWCPSKGRKNKPDGGGQNMDDYITASLKFLQDAVNNMRAGNFNAEPLNDYNCYNCHENAFCPYIQ
jgi:RecB family exonuclease